MSRHRFTVESVSNCARNVSDTFFLFFADAVLLCFACQFVQIAVEWLRKLIELLHHGCASVADRNCYIMDAIWMLGFAWNIVFFPGKRKLRCGEKLARLRDGIRRRRFTVASVWNCARNVLRVPGDFFLFFVDAVLWLWYFACVETLCAFELVHQSDAFYCSVLQFFLSFLARVCWSQWNSCVKVPHCCGCVRNTIVFCSWDS